jgi:hypothetical protein
MPIEAFSIDFTHLGSIAERAIEHTFVSRWDLGSATDVKQSNSQKRQKRNEFEF